MLPLDLQYVEIEKPILNNTHRVALKGGYEGSRMSLLLTTPL